MSLSPTAVAKVLRSPAVGQVNFKVDAIAVNQLQMESVAKAIEGNELKIEVGGTGSMGAAYTSWKGAVWKTGETRYKGRITLDGPGVVDNAIGRAAIFHESVHALIDLKDLKPSELQDEVAAYLADALFMRANNQKIPAGNPPLVTAIYAAADAIIDKHKLTTKKGVTLSWKDCEALGKAIKAWPDYSQLKE